VKTLLAICCLWGSILQGQFVYAQIAVITVEQPEIGLITLSGEGSDADYLSWDSTAPEGCYKVCCDDRVLYFGNASPGAYTFTLTAVKTLDGKLKGNKAKVVVIVPGTPPGPGPVPPVPVVDLKAKTAAALKGAAKDDLETLLGLFTALRELIVSPDSPIKSEAQAYDAFELSLVAVKWVRTGKAKGRYPAFSVLLRETFGADTATEENVSTKPMTPERRAQMGKDFASIIAGIEGVLNGK
jgi:hypothetical protein